ncbi:MAG: hypothetical protein FJY76_04235 [Candidatus Aenigmarchaeota archaeon]|nr:hypothetical protein [Candidatus Aenigmarchaeota archaeon]
MAKIEVTDECLTPEKYTYIRYTGKDPWSVAEKITEKIRPFFHVSASGTNNWRLNWDITGDVRTFYSLWWVKKDFSRFTQMKVDLKLQGEQHKDTKMGKFSLQFSGTLITKFKAWGPLLRTAWYMYSYLFYNRARRQYIKRCQSTIYSFKNELKKEFGLEETEIPSTGGTFG